MELRPPQRTSRFCQVFVITENPSPIILAATGFIQEFRTLEENTKMKRSTLASAVIATLMMLATTAFGQSSKGDANDLTGTWLANLQIPGVTASNNPGLSNQLSQILPTPNTQSPFTLVEAFHADGTYAEQSLFDFIPPPQSTPGLGVWERTKGRVFAATHYGVIIGTSNNADFEGTYRVRQKLTLDGDGDSFSGTGKIEIFDPSGNLVFVLDGILVQGRRAKVAPLP